MSGSAAAAQVTVVVGVDGAGRTHWLAKLAAGYPGPVTQVAPGGSAELADLLAQAVAQGHLVLVDDPHRLDAEDLRALTAAARQGVAMALARRPTIDRPELAELDEVVGARGSVRQLAPLDQTGVGELIEAVTGAAPDPGASARVHADSAGLPAVAAALALAPASDLDAAAPTLVARVQRKLARMQPRTAQLARLLALRLELPDPVLAAAGELDSDEFAAAMRQLHDEGLLVPGGEAMVPAVARAVAADLAASQRRRVHELIAGALLAAGGDTMVAAAQLRAARAYVPAAAQVYLAAGERLRLVDPAGAITWYDDAIEAGCTAPEAVAGRAEASALLGLPVDPGPAPAVPAVALRLGLVEGAVEGHQGRAGRSAQALVALAPPGPLVAAPALVAIGELAQARSAASAEGPVALRRLAEAAVAAGTDPAAAVPLFIEAAEAVERMPPALVLPDTPHALGALVASIAGDPASAEHLLERALATGVGGPVATGRHQLLLAWVRLRAGRYDTAVTELTRFADAALLARDRLLYAALAAGVARRSGDVARLRAAWSSVEPVLARRATDVFGLELVEELAVAAVRLRRSERAEPTLDELDQMITRLGRPAAWVVASGWLRLQVAIAAEDGDAAAAAQASLDRVDGTGLAPRHRAQIRATRRWASVLAGTVDVADVLAAGDELAGMDLPWEGSRLVGQAAIRTTDPAAARRLLERARELSSAEVVPAEARAEAHPTGLSERELEVARLVLAGGTHREIGARLFISPKTVEHHVARIRTKLGATSRAEFVAALRTALAASDAGA